MLTNPVISGNAGMTLIWPGFVAAPLERRVDAGMVQAERSELVGRLLAGRIGLACKPSGWMPWRA